MIYDHSDWHRAKMAPHLPASAACAPMGLFLGWIVSRGLDNPILGASQPDLLDQLRARERTGPDFVETCCNGVLSGDALASRVRRFARDYYVSGEYLVDFERELMPAGATIYDVVGTWQDFDHLAPVLDRRLAEWREAERQRLAALPSLAGTIDPASGEIAVDGSPQNIAPSWTRAGFLASSLGATAREGLSAGPNVAFDLEIVVGETAFDVTLRFESDVLRSVELTCRGKDRSGDALLDFHEDWLARALGGEREFAWGHVSATTDPHGGESVVAIRYK